VAIHLLVKTTEKLAQEFTKI